MKRLLAAYGTFSRMERMGLVGLAALLLLLLSVRAALPYFIHPPDTSLEDRKLQLAWEQFRAAQAASPEHFSVAAEEAAVPATLFRFDPNTLDSVGFRRLGLSARVTKGLMNWRRKGKKFYRPEDLKPLYNLKEEEYARLAPYIAITLENPQARTFSHSSWQHSPPLPAVIDLNRTDSATLVRLNGIGPTLARKIIARRAALGGFLRHEQLLEIYRFPDSTYKMLQERLRIRPEGVQRMNLNTVTLERLNAHPYIGEKTARNLLLYREGIGRYEKVEDLRQVPLMNEEIYRKIAPYFTTE